MQVFVPTCIPDSHLYRITSTKCRINTVVSPDDGHIVARNMYRKKINILRKIVQQVSFIYIIILQSEFPTIQESWFKNTASVKTCCPHNCLLMYVYVRIYRFQNVFLRCPTYRLHCFLSSHWPSFRFLSFIAFFIPFI